MKNYIEKRAEEMTAKELMQYMNPEQLQSLAQSFAPDLKDSKYTWELFEYMLKLYHDITGEEMILSND